MIFMSMYMYVCTYVCIYVLLSTNRKVLHNINYTFWPVKCYKIKLQDLKKIEIVG